VCGTLHIRYLALVAQLFPPQEAAAADPTVFTGSGGRALMYLRRYDNFGNQSDLATAQVRRSKYCASRRLPTSVSV
jgi:hypothetical protein